MVSLLDRCRLTGFLRGLGGRMQNAEDIVLAHDDVLCAIQFCFVAGVLPKQDAVSDSNVESNQFTTLEPLAMTNGHDLALLRFLLGGVGNDDAMAWSLVPRSASPQCGHIK